MDGTLSDSLVDWLAGEPHAKGQGTAWHFESSWELPPWMTLVVIGLIVATVLYVYSRESAVLSRRLRVLLASLRLAAIGLLLLMISEAFIGLQRTGLPSVAVILDRSGSMGITDPYDPDGRERIQTALGINTPRLPSRLELAKRLLLGKRDLLGHLHERYSVDAYLVDDTVSHANGGVTDVTREIAEATANEDPARATRLGAAVREVLAANQGAPPAAVVLLSDGITTSGQTLPDAASSAQRKGVPLYVVGIGEETAGRDVQIADALVDDAVFAGDILSVEAVVEATGLAGRPANVTLRDAETNEVLAEAEVRLGDLDDTQRVRLLYRTESPGELQLELEVEAFADELDTENNLIARTVQVRDEQVRVLLATSAPTYEFRFLKHLLERDETIDLDVFLQQADARYAQQDQSAIAVFPVRREDLYRYDVLIVGDLDPRRLGRSVMRNIKSFVTEKGGGLILVAGPRFMPERFVDVEPIVDLLPFEPSAIDALDLGQDPRAGFVMQPTAIGLLNPALQLGDSPTETAEIWKRLPPLYWMLPIRNLKPAARVLAEHPPQSISARGRLPLVILQYVGAGKVLFHATDETYRWRYQVGDVYFARYWVQAIRYLARSKLLGGDHRVEVSAARPEFAQGEPVRIRARFFDERRAPVANDGVQLLVQNRLDARRFVTLTRTATARGIFEGTLTDLAPGQYDVMMVTPASEGRAPRDAFRVLAPPGEFARTTRDTAALAQAAQISLGRFYELHEADEILTDLPRGRQVPIEPLPPLTIWNQWWLLATVVGLFSTEWLIRKRKGLL